MTESKTEKSAKRGGLAWKKARRVPFLSQYAKGLTDWPDAFSPKDLAALQYPDEGTDPERIRAMRNRNALTASLTGLVEDGDIPAVTVNYIPPAPKMPAGPVVVLHDDPWMNVDTDWMGYRPPPPLPPSPQPIEFKTIGREPFAAWFHGQGEEPSEHIRAWLGTEWQATPKPEPRQDGKKTDRREKQIQAIVDTARALEYDPLDIPLGGRAAIMAHCLNHRKEFGASKNSFDNAWDEANKQVRIRIHGKERFMTE